MKRTDIEPNQMDHVARTAEYFDSQDFCRQLTDIEQAVFDACYEDVTRERLRFEDYLYIG